MIYRDRRKSRRYSAGTPPLKRSGPTCAYDTKPALDPQPSNERMKTMANHSSATARIETPHVNQTTRTNTIINALKRRAEAVLKDKSIDAQSRAIIRYALETNDPWLAKLVRRADAGEDVFDDLQSLETNENDSSDDKIAALAEMICRAGDEPATKSAALLVLMAAVENATHPRALANTAKHVAFTRCGELNFRGMVDAQIAVLESELLRA
jgi:hypothetical protein